MSAGPIGSKLVLLNSLPDISEGTKVRFLGCVQRYSARKGVVYLNHSHCSPSSASTSQCIRENKLVTAIVDVIHALGGETYQDKDLEIGSWINIVGYTCRGQNKRSRRHSKESDNLGQTAVDSRRISKGHDVVKVQALMIWSAGSLRLDAYEQSVRMRMDNES